MDAHLLLIMLTYLHLKPMADLPQLPKAKALGVVVVVDAAVSNVWRNQVCDLLAAAGCKTMAAWGIDCSAWDDAMDWANIAMFMPSEVPDEHLILTTWHTDETLSEFFDFCKAQPASTEALVEQHLLLHIGTVDRRDVLMRAWGAVL